MTFEQAKTIKANLEAQMAFAAAAFEAFPRGPMGLTPDEVKFSPAYRSAKATFDGAFATVRAHNALMTKRFAKEMRDERRTRRAG